jgi:hypothetical protein
MSKKVFVFDGVDHSPGGVECPECWDGQTTPCSCGGRIHYEFGDTRANEDFFLNKMCDKCNKRNMDLE